MSLRNRIYRSMETPPTARDLHAFTEERGIDVSWIVEAGCHDASDTEILATLFNPVKIYAFEPDPVAFEIAKSRIENLASKSHAIELLKIALMNVSGEGNLFFVGIAGGGSTQIRETETSMHDDAVRTSKLDDLGIPEASKGLLWLDVEGNAVLALQGMQESLTKFNLAKIEVEFHDMSTFRTQNFRQVINIMKQSDFKLIKSYIQPGFFGDLLFVSKRQLSFSDYLNSFLVTWTTIVLHSLIYPILKKPKRF